MVSNMDIAVLEIFFSDFNNAAVPYCYGFGLDGENKFGRDINEVFDAINRLLESEAECRVYSFKLERLYNLFMHSMFVEEMTEPIVRGDDEILSFDLGCIKFCSIRAIVGSVSFYDFNKVKVRRDLLLPSSSIRNHQWIKDDMKKILDSEFTYVSNYVKECGNHIPLTLAKKMELDLASCCFGMPSADIRELAKKEGSSVWEKRNKYLNNVIGFQGNKMPIIDVNHFKFLRRAFCGGLVADNLSYRDILLDNIKCRDVNSMYPSQFVKNKFPIEYIGKYTDMPESQVKAWAKEDKWMIVMVDMRDIQSISPCKCISTRITHDGQDDGCCKFYPDSCLVDLDGGVESAKRLRWFGTYKEFLLLKKYYTFTYRIRVVELYNTGYLPIEYVSYMLMLYKEKCEAKKYNGTDEEWKYVRAKTPVNMCWGFMASKWYYDTTDELDDLIKQYNKASGKFFNRTWCYQWAIAITSYARCALLSVIYRLGDDWLYSDTDSIYYRGEHEDLFELYNKGNCECISQNLPIEYVTYDGKTLGCFYSDVKGSDSYTYFKYFASKCYVGVVTDRYGKCLPKIKTAVSGCADFDMINWWRNEFNCDWDKFFDYFRAPVDNDIHTIPNKYCSFRRSKEFKSGMYTLTDEDGKSETSYIHGGIYYVCNDFPIAPKQTRDAIEAFIV